MPYVTQDCHLDSHSLICARDTNHSTRADPLWPHTRLFAAGTALRSRFRARASVLGGAGGLWSKCPHFGVLFWRRLFIILTRYRKPSSWGSSLSNTPPRAVAGQSMWAIRNTHAANVIVLSPPLSPGPTHGSQTLFPARPALGTWTLGGCT